VFDIDEKIKDVDEAICDNIDKIDVLGRGLASQNILAQTRNLLEYIAIKAYSINHEIRHDKETNKAAITYIRSEYKFLFLRKFHYLLQESKSHYTPDNDGAERLALKYHEYYILLRDFVKQEYGLEILHNLEVFPLDLDMTVKGYYQQVTKSLKKNWPTTDFSRARMYVMRSKPIYVDGEMIYENTLIPAGDYVSKFDRFIAFSRNMIADHYAIQASIFSDEITVDKQKMPIIILTDFTVSLRPCELNNFSKIFGYRTKINASYAEYKGIMKYLTITGGTITDILTSDDRTYAYIRGQILNNAKTIMICDVFDEARKIVNNNMPGANMIRYLSCIMRNQVIKDQYNDTANPRLSSLYLKYGCIPFDQMPFATSPIGHNAELKDIYSCISDENRQHELLAKRLQINTTVNGELYTKSDDLKDFGDLDTLVKRYNDSLYYKHVAARSVNHFGKNYYINEYFEDTKAIISKLIDLSQNGIGGYRNSIQYWMEQNPEVVNCEEKKEILLDMFETSRVSLIYGAVGTGKTYLLNHISQFFDEKNKLYLANTNPAVDNLKRKVKAQNCSFYTVTRFVKNTSIASEYDIVIIDECSMVSNSDMRRVLEKANFKLLVLVGDTYQIESITFGNWFGLARFFLNKNTWHELKHPYRAKNQELLDLWGKVRNLDDDITEHLVNYKYSSVLNESIFDRASDDEIILCLNYNGLYGINNINRFLQNSNPNRGETWGVWKYKVGDPVLFNETERFAPIIYNNLKGKIVGIYKEEDRIRFEIEIEKCLNEWDIEDVDLDLVNNTSEKSVIGFWIYANDDEDGEDDFNSVVPFQIAYAVSIHKAQGLEYDSVKIVITEDIDELITHNIFYTAITRAKDKLKIFWSHESQTRVLKSFNRTNELNEATIFSAQANLRICCKKLCIS
jgi:hypothetical protein